MSVDLSIVIVHHNAEDFLRKCLRSIPGGAGGVSHEAIVVDNASRGLDRLIPEFKNVRWIQNDQNLGFAKAVNQGAESSSGRIVVLLNPDAELLPGALKSVHRFLAQEYSKSSGLESNPAKIGPVGGKLLFSDGSLQPSCGPFPDLANLVCRLALPREKRRYYLRDFGAAPPASSVLNSGSIRAARVDWVTGAFLAVRRSVFDRLGGFDEDFFLYYEDVDFCLRAREQGFNSYYLPEAVAYHHRPHAIRKTADSVLRSMIQTSRYLYFQKHRPAWETWVLKNIQRLEPMR